MLTPEEINARHSRIGASDVATILGMPTFAGRNAFTTWLEKTDQLEPEKRDKNKAITWGNKLEPLVLDHAERSHGPLRRNVIVWDPAGSPIASTLDGEVISSGVPIEAKTSGIEGPIHGRWGEAGTDEVPDAYLIQCQVQLLCTKAEICHLVALLGGRGMMEFAIEPVPELQDLIRNVSDDFFSNYVKAVKDPRIDWAARLTDVHGIKLEGDPCAPPLEICKRYRRVPNKVIEFEDPDDVLYWQASRQARLDAEKTEKAALATVLANLGDAEAAALPGGSMLTYFEQGGAARIDREKMKQDGVYDVYATPSRHRVARIKKGR